MKHESKFCYVYDSNGYYIGVDSDYGFGLPNNSTYTKPTFVDGYIPRWRNGKWNQVETHVGEKGFVNNEPFEVKNHGPLPEGFTTEWVDPRTPAEIRRDEIERRLLDIDNESIRPTRAINAEKGTVYDHQKLAALEDEAAALRQELASLPVPEPATSPEGNANA